MTTTEQLTQVFNDNFVAYYRSHVAHVNIVGRNFYSDHKLLQKIYESLQEQIDTIAELLRSLYEEMPDSIDLVIQESHLPTDAISGDSTELLSAIYDDIEHLKGEYEDLIKIATEEGHDEIANYAQDRVLTLSKQCWMLRSTLD
jgi:starvation-inducible DNA-binding protein